MARLIQVTLAVALAVLLMLPSLGAQTNKTGERMRWTTWYSHQDPANTDLGQSPWLDTLIHPEDTVSTDSIVVLPGETVWFGSQNQQQDDMKKKYFLILKGVNLDLLEADTLASYDNTGSDAKYSYYSLEKSGGQDSVRFYALIVPQPEWEVLALNNAGSDTVKVLRGFGNTYCYETVPSLTGYGIAVLVLLLLASTIWVLRRQRATA